MEVPRVYIFLRDLETHANRHTSLSLRIHRYYFLKMYYSEGCANRRQAQVIPSTMDVNLKRQNSGNLETYFIVKTEINSMVFLLIGKIMFSK